MRPWSTLLPYKNFITIRFFYFDVRANALDPVTLTSVGEKPISQLYINVTIKIMEKFGIEVTRSNSETYTYYIQKDHYINPREYIIESDASSATYPLVFAGLIGSTVTIPNIGYEFLKGDAMFDLDVLKPIGCNVIQTANFYNSHSPSKSQLKLLTFIDMEKMTDTFLTACVAAIATNKKPNESKVTTIRSIANQRLNECNGICKV